MEAIESHDEFFKGTFQLKNLGRNHVNKTVELDGEYSFYGELKKHLMSQEIEWSYNFDSNIGNIFVGLRNVGTFVKVGNA